MTEVGLGRAEGGEGEGPEVRGEGGTIGQAAVPPEGGVILVVEDNPANLLMIRVVLEQTGYRPVLTQSVEEAERWLADNQPDLILMDVQLPNVDGFEYTRRLRARPATALVPIIALTAFSLSGDERRALEAGCDAFIVKPIDVLGLPAQIGEMLRARRQVGDSEP